MCATISQFLPRWRWFLLPLSHAGLTRIGGIAVVGRCRRRRRIGLVVRIGGRVRGTSGCSCSSCRRIVRIRRRWIIPLGLILRSGGRGLVRRILIRVGAALGDVGWGSFVATGGTGSHGTAASVGHWKTRIWPVERGTVGTHGLCRAGTAGAAGSCRRGIGRVRCKRGRTGSLLVSVVGSDLGGDSGTSGSRCRTHVTLRLLWKLLWLLLLLMLS